MVDSQAIDRRRCRAIKGAAANLTTTREEPDMEDWDEPDGPYPHADLPDRFHQQMVNQLSAEDADGAGFVAHTLLDFLWSYRGVPLEKLDTNAFDEYLFDFFPRKISAEESLVQRMPDLLIRFLEFAATEGVLRRVQPLIDLVQQNRRDFIQAALDPRNFGMAKSLVMQMRAEGYDPTDQDQLNEFMLLYNQRLLAQHPPLPPAPPPSQSQPTRQGGLGLSKKNLMDMMLRQMDKDAEFRAFALEKLRDRWTLDKVRQMSTEEIIAQLQSFGVPFDTQAFLERDVKRFRSAEVLSDHWCDVYEITATGFDEDFIFIAAIVLWERLAPDVVNVEMLDDWMQEGYKLIEAEPRPKTQEACEIWLRVWDHFKTWLTPDMTTVEQADDIFPGLQSIFNWCQELEAELHNAGLDDPRFFHERLRYCQEFCRQFHEDEEMIPHFLRAEAETYFSLGQEAEGVRKFEQLIARFPDWAWGYIGWGDEYWMMKDSVKDYARAEQIYRKALERPALEDRDIIYDRLADLYEEMGNQEKAKRYAQLAVEARRPVQPAITLPPNLFPAKPKKSQPSSAKPSVSRNQPCPCGSGRKYKRCCRR
jgi:hypothetical protein